MTVLVTGAGLIGRLTAEALAARGDRVVLLDLHAPAGVLGEGIAFIRCDVTDRAGLAAVIADHAVTGIVHTAAMLSTGIRKDPVKGIEVNVMGTANLLECARQAGVRRVVCASSTTVAYTTFARHGAGPIAEDEPLHLVSERPASLYAASKIAGEHIALLYRDLYGLDAVVLRYGAVLGGSLEAPTSVPGRLLARLAEGGRSGRTVVLDDPFLLWGGREEFVDARDCAAANLCALDAAAPRQGVYNIATGAWHSLAEFVEAMRGIFPDLEVEPLPDPPTGFAGFPHRRPAPSSVEAAARELGFSCRYSLEETLRYWTA